MLSFWCVCYLPLLGASFTLVLSSQGTGCAMNGIVVNDACYWSPGHPASDLSATFLECQQQGGQPFTFASVEEARNITTLLGVDTTEVFVPAMSDNGTYHWFSNDTADHQHEAFFSRLVTNRHVSSKQCVTVARAQFTAQACTGQFRFVCQTYISASLSSSTPQATVDPNQGAGNSSALCTPPDDANCIPFKSVLIGVFGRLKEDALDFILNDTGADLGYVISGRQNPSPQPNTPWGVIQILHENLNNTNVSSQQIESLDVSNITQQLARDSLRAIYQLLVVDNSTEDGLDDRVAALLFKMAYVPFVDEDMLTVFARSTALVIHGEEQKPEETELKEAQGVRILQSMEHILTTANVTTYSHRLTQLAVRVTEVNATSAENDVTVDAMVGGKKNTIALSRTLFPNDHGQVSSVVYRDLHRLLPSNRQGALTGGQVASPVVSVVIRNGLDCGGSRATVSPDCSQDFTVNFTLPFLLTREDTERPGEETKRRCVYWKFRIGAWSEDGCWLLELNTTHTTCTCNHLSTFAVLVTFTKSAQVSEENVKAMFVLTAIGCSLSIAGLALTLFTYIYLRILHRERILIHANLALSLLLAQMLFISSDSAHSSKVACKAVAALLHFLFMAAFSWMMVEGVALYRTCTRGLLYACDMRLKYAAMGWGVPIVVVVISLGLQFPNYGHGLHNSCWLSVEKGLIWAFLAPMLVIVSLNVLILGLVIRVFLTLRANSQKTEAARARAGLRAMVMLLPLLGSTWLLSLLVPVSSVFGYLFILFNSLQGLMIFVLHCLCNEEVRRFLARRRGNHKSRTRTSESNLSVVGRRRHSPALTFDDVKLGMSGRDISSSHDDRRNAWV